METRLVDVALLPDEMEKIRAEGFAAVVIDILRASTTIVTALANGAARVIPLTTVEEARARREKEPESLLGGERNAVPPPGFDLGNSPREYTPERVNGKTIIITTTNGTRACQSADRAGAGPVVIGGFVNLQAVTDFCRSFKGPTAFCLRRLPGAIFPGGLPIRRRRDQKDGQRFSAHRWSEDVSYPV